MIHLFQTHHPTKIITLPGQIVKMKTMLTYLQNNYRIHLIFRFRHLKHTKKEIINSLDNWHKMP